MSFMYGMHIFDNHNQSFKYLMYFFTLLLVYKLSTEYIKYLIYTRISFILHYILVCRPVFMWVVLISSLWPRNVCLLFSVSSNHFSMQQKKLHTRIWSTRSFILCCVISRRRSWRCPKSKVSQARNKRNLL